MARVSVQHLVLNRLTRRYGQRFTSDLLGVEYVVEVPPDTEFPKSITQLDVFFRLVVKKTSSIRTRLRVRWLDPPLGKAVDVYFTPRRSVPVIPNSVLDGGIRLSHLSLPGTGRYAIDFRYRERLGYREYRWVTLRREYFFVERQP